MVARASDWRLSEEQVAVYYREGYVVVPGVFGQGELDRINADLDQVLTSKPTEGDPAGKGWIFSLGQQTELAREVCRDERVLDLVSLLVRPGIAIYSAKLVTKEPFDQTVCHWHQDDAYYTKHSASRCRLSVYIALCDITPEMGCLQVIPGSHRTGLREAEVQQTGMCRLAMKQRPNLERARYVPMSAGSVLIFSALLHHGSTGNTTERRRRAFIVSYQEATATVGNGAQWEILRAG